MTTARHRSRGGPATERYEQVVIEGISPSIDGGRHPVKGIVGDTIKVEATVFKHGHDGVRVALRWLPPGEMTSDERPMALVNPGLDLCRGELRLERPGRYRFHIAAWTDVFASWVEEFRKRVIAGQPESNTSLRVGSTLAFTLFRRVEPGENLEVEIGRFLTSRTPFRAMSALEGSLTYVPASGASVTLPPRLTSDMTRLGAITADFSRRSRIGRLHRGIPARAVPVATVIPPAEPCIKGCRRTAPTHRPRRRNAHRRRRTHTS